MPLIWTRQLDKGGDVSFEDSKVSYEWDEGWNAVGYDPPVGTPAWVGLLTDFPELSPGRLHPTITSAYVSKFKADRNGTAPAWDVTVSYRVGDPKEFDLPPTQRAAVIEVNPEAVEVATTTKADGTGWVTATGEHFSGLTRVENHWMFSIRKNVEAVPAWALEYASAVNSDAINIRGLSIDAHYLLLKELRIGNLDKERVNSIDYLFYPVDFTLVYNPRTWMTKVLHRGLDRFESDLTTRTYCLDTKGQRSDEPQFLAADGTQLGLVTVGATTKLGPVDPNDINTVDGWDYDLLPFAALPLS